jgi:hypothetical protein
VSAKGPAAAGGQRCRDGSHCAPPPRARRAPGGAGRGRGREQLVHVGQRGVGGAGRGSVAAAVVARQDVGAGGGCGRAVGTEAGGAGGGGRGAQRRRGEDMIKGWARAREEEAAGSPRGPRAQPPAGGRAPSVAAGRLLLGARLCRERVHGAGQHLAVLEVVARRDEVAAGLARLAARVAARRAELGGGGARGARVRQVGVAAALLWQGRLSSLGRGRKNGRPPCLPPPPRAPLPGRAARAVVVLWARQAVAVVPCVGDALAAQPVGRGVLGARLARALGGGGRRRGGGWRQGGGPSGKERSSPAARPPPP